MVVPTMWHPRRADVIARRHGSQLARGRSAIGDPETAIPAPRTAEDIRTVLGQVVSDVRSGKLDTKIAITMEYVANVQLRAFEVADLERRVKLLEDGDLKGFLQSIKGRTEEELEFFATNGYWPEAANSEVRQ